MAFVELNIKECYDLVDYFLICEAEFSHTGEIRGFTQMENVLERFLKQYPKCRYIRIHADSRVSASLLDSGIMHRNEQLIRDGFRKEFEVFPSDIVISVDADEVLFSQRVKKILKKLNRKYFKRTSYLLRLHQMIYLIGYHWVDCNFQGPTISRASHFLIMENPQWRYSGTRTFLRSGTHFSWVMTINEMIQKIQFYAHRDTSIQFAEQEILEEAIRSKRYIFDQERKFTIREIYNLKSSRFPKSLQLNRHLFEPELYCETAKVINEN